MWLSASKEIEEGNRLGETFHESGHAACIIYGENVVPFRLQKNGLDE